MSRLLTVLLACCTTLALSGVSLAEDQSSRSEPPQEQNQEDQAGQATGETDIQGQQAITDSNDQDEQAAADDEETVVIIVPDDQDEHAANDADAQDVVVIVVPEDQDEQASVTSEIVDPAVQGGRQTAQERNSQPTQINGKDGAEEIQDAVISAPDYSAELKKCDWAKGKRRTHCIEATKKQFGEM